MKVFINDQERPEFSGLSSASEILEAVRSYISKEGRVITSMSLDGMDIDEDIFIKTSSGMSVNFTSCPVNDLVKETLEEAEAYIPRLISGFSEIASHFEGNELSKAQGKLAEALDGLDWLLTVYSRCSALLLMNPSELEQKALQDTLLNSINRLNDLLVDKKYLQTALCIRQQLLPGIENISMLLRKLADSVSSSLSAN